MFQKLADHIRGGYLLAADCDARAKRAIDEQSRKNHLQMARAWRHVARNYEYVESLERFLFDAYKNGWPLSIEDLPKPQAVADQSLKLIGRLQHPFHGSLLLTVSRLPT
jgi:hypothetical protein